MLLLGTAYTNKSHKNTQPQKRRSHETVVEASGGQGDELEGLQHAGSTDDGVGGGDGRDDILDHALGQL